MIIKMMVTLCHMASVGPAMPAVEFCQERFVEESDVVVPPVDPKTQEKMAKAACMNAVQPTIAPRILPGYTFKEARCLGPSDDQTPKGSI